MKRINYSITENSTVVFIDGEVYTIPRTNPNYGKIIQVLMDNMDENYQIERVREMADIKTSIETYVEGRISIEGESIKYKGESIPMDALYERIMGLKREGQKFEYLIKFLDNLMENPNVDSRQDLYRFLSKNNLPITSRGTFLAYKKVQGDYTDIHSGQFSNAPGTIVEMDRDEVDPNRNNTCSAGFHAASYDYLPHYGTSDSNKVVIVEINPKDVVSVPIDYDDAKLRTCRYEVIGEMDNPFYQLRSNYVDVENEEEYFDDEEDFEEEDNYFDDYYEEEQEDEWDGEFTPYGVEEKEEQNEPVKWISNGVEKEGEILTMVYAEEPLDLDIKRYQDVFGYNVVNFTKVRKAKNVSSKDRYLVLVKKVDGVELKTPILYAPNTYQVDAF